MKFATNNKQQIKKIHAAVFAVCCALFVMSFSTVFAASTTTDSFKVFLTVNQETAVTPTGGASGGVGTNFPVITSLNVVPSTNGAVITYTTSIPTTATLIYGKTSAQTSGTSTDIIFSTIHTATISNLTTATLYYFSIDVVSQTGAHGTSGIGKFTTLSITPVTNALSFSATAETSDIRLDWR
ncbi:MAG: hypothetical protein WA051_00655, partial [Minisyncoccia bacterium]